MKIMIFNTTFFCIHNDSNVTMSSFSDSDFYFVNKHIYLVNPAHSKAIGKQKRTLVLMLIFGNFSLPFTKHLGLQWWKP